MRSFILLFFIVCSFIICDSLPIVPGTEDIECIGCNANEAAKLRAKRAYEYHHYESSQKYESSQSETHYYSGPTRHIFNVGLGAGNSNYIRIA